MVHEHPRRKQGTLDSPKFADLGTPWELLRDWEEQPPIHTPYGPRYVYARWYPNGIVAEVLSDPNFGLGGWGWNVTRPRPDMLVDVEGGSEETLEAALLEADQHARQVHDA